MYQLSRWLKNNWPFVFIIISIFIFFWKFFFKNLLPIPADIIPGTYFPWYDVHFASHPYGIAVKNNILSDVVSIMYPWRMLSIDLIKQGIAPLWNPYILSGNVLLANFQSAAFYPLNFLYWIIPNFATAWSIQIIMQPLLAWIFMFIFLRNNKLSKLASVFGSSVWAFSGFFAVWYEYNTIVQASLYFPLILYSIQKGFENRKFYLLLIIAISFSFYAGYPQITLYEILFAGIFTLTVYRLFQFKKYTTLLVCVLLGIGLALPFLLPGYEAAKLSIRSVDNVANSSHVKFALPEQLITFIAPDYYGNPTSRNYWLIGGTYENAIVFAGVPAFMLFLLSFFIDKRRRTKLLWYAWITSFISIIFVFKNPISQYLGNLNFFLFSASVMGRFAVMLMFGIGVSSALVLEDFILGKVSFKKVLLPIVFISLLIFIYGIFGYITHNTVSIRNLILPSLIFLVTTILIFVVIKFKNINYKISLIICILLVEIFDLYHFHDKYNSFSSPDFLYPKTSITDFLKSQSPSRFETEGGPVMPPNMWMPYGLYSASGQDAIGSLRYNKFLGFINSGKFLASDRYAGITNFDSPLFDFLGINNVIGIKWKNNTPDFEGTTSAKFNNPKFQKVFDNDRSLVLKNTKAFPLIFAVESFVLAKTDDDFSKLLISTDLNKTVILEEAPVKPFSKTDIKITNIVFNNNSTDITLTNSGDTMLVLTQSYFPGWKAYVDGSETKLFRADYNFMSVQIPVGNHKILIKYEPDSFKFGIVGGIISLVSFIFLFFKFKKNH